MKKTTIKTQLILFLSFFAIYLSIKDKDTLFLLTTFITVISAIGADSLLLCLKNKKFTPLHPESLVSFRPRDEWENRVKHQKNATPFRLGVTGFTVTESSIISGLIIGYVLSQDNTWWIFISASLFAILSKHLIRINKKHIFNPAAFGIFLTIILFNAVTQWKGTYLWYIIAPFGFYFIIKIRKLALLVSYLLTSLILFSSQAFIEKISLLNILGYFSYFFVFIMLIEPKTTPINLVGKIIFGTQTAVLFFILNEIGVKFDAEIGALLVSNLATPLLNKFTKR